MINLALEAPIMEIYKFIKRSNKEMIGVRGVTEIEKSSPDSPRLEMSKLIKRSNKEMTGFRGRTQIEKSGPGGTTHGNL